MLGIAAAIIVMAAAAAWFFRPRTTAPPTELTQKRLTFNPSENPVGGAAISPDGRYLAYSDPAGIHAKLLSTGEERLIQKPAGVPAGATWEVASWFPDGTQLLATTWELGVASSTWTVSMLGQSPRELRDDAFGRGVSPDGTHIVFLPPGGSDFHEVWVMDSQGNNPQKVLALGEGESILNGSVRWSPNGERLAYLKMERTAEGAQSSIETCNLKGASRTVVLTSVNLYLPDFGWLPDGRIIYSRQESSGAFEANLWQVGINDHTGAPTGKPKRITQWAGSSIWSFSASTDGKRLAFDRMSSQVQVYIGELAGGGTHMNPPRRLTSDEANDEPHAWTPDSKAVLFTSDRNGTRGIFKQPINADEAQAVITGPQEAYDPRVSPDGEWMLYQETPKGAGPSAPMRLMRIPIAGGVPQLVLETRNGGMSCARAPASLCVVFERDEKKMTLTAFDPLKGRGKALRSMQKFPGASITAGLSPDGSTFAIAKVGGPEIHIRLLSLSGVSDREITVKGWPNITGLDWSADGKGMYLGSLSAQGNTLLCVDLNGNARVLWQRKGSPFGFSFWGVPSPDGRYLAISGEARNSNVWMLEGF